MESLKNFVNPKKNNKKPIKIEESLESKFTPRYPIGQNKYISCNGNSFFFHLNPKLQDTLDEPVYKKAKEIVEDVKIVPAKGNQGITFNSRQEFKIKLLGNNGKGDIRIKGHPEKELDGTTTIVFDEVNTHKSKSY